jgi:hypothetical protein
MVNKESWFLQKSKFIDEYGLEFSNVLFNGFSYAAVGLLYSSNKTLIWEFLTFKRLSYLLLLVSVIVNIFFFINQKKKSKSLKSFEEDSNKKALKIQSLENKIQSIHKNYTEIFNEHLASLYFKLKLSNDSRISMYKLENDNFYIIGRYSINPDLYKINRNYYPSNQGLIALALSNGNYFLNTGVPEYGNKPRQKTIVFNFFNSISPIDRDVFDKITMKSKSFYLRALLDPKNIQRTSIIVIESTKNKAFEKEDIDAIIEDEENKLTSFVEKIDWNLPSLVNAQVKGF